LLVSEGGKRGIIHRKELISELNLSSNSFYSFHFISWSLSIREQNTFLHPLFHALHNFTNNNHQFITLFSTCMMQLELQGFIGSSHTSSPPSLSSYLTLFLANPFPIETLLMEKNSACVYGRLTRNHLPQILTTRYSHDSINFPFLGLNHKPPNSHKFCPCVACWISSFVGD
jgi:hypothetical protein